MIYHEIDIIKLYAGQIQGFENAEAWNTWLRACRKGQKVNELVTVRKGLQIGMTNAEKKKLTDEKINNTFCRWMGSIDKTLRLIMKDKGQYNTDYKTKKERENDLEKYLRSQSY